MSRLAFSGVSKSYARDGQTFEAVRAIDLTLTDQEFVTIIGPNGCGKSTLLKIAAGIIETYDGRLEHRGRISYVPQNLSLLPWKTVLSNLMLPLAIHNQPKALHAATKLLKQFGLDDYAQAYPHQLSGGMQQKLTMLRAVISKPDILLLDEPFSSLDAITRAKTQLWLSELLASAKATVLMVTHDIREAVLLSDRVVVISGQPGMIVADITVPLQRPRTHAQLSSAQCLKLQNRLEKLLI